MRPPRFRLRTLVIGVAAGALALWVVRSYRDVKRYEFLQVMHWVTASVNRKICDGDGLIHAATHSRIKPPPRKASVAEIAQARRRAVYHEAMAEKYEWAARYPWMPIWPDPPEPK